MRGLCSLILVLIPTLAFAGPKKPLPGSKRAEPVEVAENFTAIDVSSQDKAYKPRLFFSLTTWGANDRVRVDWKQKGKVLAAVPCKMTEDYVECSGDKSIKAKGAIEADVILEDNSDDKEYLVRTFKVTVEQTKKGFETLFNVVADDLLGIAYALHVKGKYSGEAGRPRFQFWVARRDGEANTLEGPIRCTVDGKTIDDLKADITETTLGIGTINGAPPLEHWTNVSLIPYIKFGPKTEKTTDRYLVDNPGKWDCAVRSEGKAIRQVLFTVNKEGMIEDDEMQTGKRPITLQADSVLVDIRIPKDSTFDQRLRPDLMKKTVNFGLPWPDHPKVKTIHAAFPPKR